MFRSLTKMSIPVPGRGTKLIVPNRLKVTFLGITFLGLSLFGFFAFFYRKHYVRRKNSRQSPKTPQRNPQNHVSGQEPRQKFSRPLSSKPSQHSSSTVTTNGAVTPHLTPSAASENDVKMDSTNVSGHMLKHQCCASTSNFHGMSGVSSSSTVMRHSLIDVDDLSPLHLCQLGMQYLSQAVAYWEEAVMKQTFHDDSSLPANTDPGEGRLQRCLQLLLESAHSMQAGNGHLFEGYDDRMLSSSTLTVYSSAKGDRWPADDDPSDLESFVSAADMATLADLDCHRELLHTFPLYEKGLLELRSGRVSCRVLRSKMADCLSDVEFLAKLYGIRQAFEVIFASSENQDWFADTGQSLIGSILNAAGKDAEEFRRCYGNLLSYVGRPSAWPQITLELAARGVNTMSFYDIVLDFILMDAFDDLDNPPLSVKTVINNRWLSNSFKQTALTTACWSVLKAKRSLMQYQGGFVAHFYAMCEHISPVLAWGFLGPHGDLKRACISFKDLVLEYFRDIFSFQRVRYTSVEDLAEDILSRAQHASEKASEFLKQAPNPYCFGDSETTET